MSAIIKNIDAIPGTGWYDAKIRVNEEGVAGIIVDLPTPDGGVDTKIFPIELITSQHGDLIDRKKLINSLETMKKHDCGRCPRNLDKYHCKGCWYPFMIDFVKNIPSVVEAEE